MQRPLRQEQWQSLHHRERLAEEADRDTHSRDLDTGLEMAIEKPEAE